MTEETPVEEAPAVGSLLAEEQPEATPILYIVSAVVVVFAVCGFLFVRRKKKKKPSVEIDETLATNSVSLKDINYLASKLGPDSTHMDVFLAVASCPDSIKYGLRGYENKERVRKERIKQDEEEKKSTKSSGDSSKNLFDLDDEGWADEDDDGDDEEAREKAALAKAADEQKKKEQEQLKKATGKMKILLEGIDDGVIGQEWVENTLESKGAWPPKDLSFLKDESFDYNGTEVSALDHPGLRRNICMIMGRINSLMLNTHPELLEAGSKQLVDQTYFKASMEFRQRCAMLLEAALRTAVACRSYALSKTVVQTVSLFKIGCPPPGDVEWFDGMMEKQYQCLPRLEIADTSIECPGEAEMATGDTLTLALDVTRLHAEAFTKQKVAMFQKQGIPPQLALQTYREGWWFLVRAERLDGDIPPSSLDLKTDGLLNEVPKSDLEKFDQVPYPERLQTAWPMIVQNITQKTGKVKLQFLAPTLPGNYRFTVSVNSQDFLGADKEFSVEGTIVDESTIVRKPKENDAESVEDKKDK
eukprot:scaffold19_cov114-Cylindrotheca_fusiformis.AAC.49